MGLWKRLNQPASERTLRRMLWLVDPVAAKHGVGPVDAGDGPAARIRRAQREQALIAEQQETNRLLREAAQRD